VTWIGTGNVDTMMGRLKTKKQVRCPRKLVVAVNDSKSRAGARCCLTERMRRFGTSISAARCRDVAFYPAIDIDKDPAKMQAFVTAIWRATAMDQKHIRRTKIYDGDRALCRQSSRGANILEIHRATKVTDYRRTIDSGRLAVSVFGREMIPASSRPNCRRGQPPTFSRGGANRAYPP